MRTDVASEKVKHAAESLYRLIRDHVPTNGQAGDVESFLALASLLADSIRAAWDQVLGRLRAGMDAEEARACADGLCLAADAWSAATRSLEDLAAEVARQTGKPIEGISELAAEAARTGEVRAAARRVLDSLNAARDEPLDQHMLAQAEADFAGGRVQKGKEVIPRLRTRR